MSPIHYFYFTMILLVSELLGDVVTHNIIRNCGNFWMQASVFGVLQLKKKKVM